MESTGDVSSFGFGMKYNVKYYLNNLTASGGQRHGSSERHRPFTKDDRVQFRASSYEIYGVQNGTWTGPSGDAAGETG